MPHRIGLVLAPFDAPFLALQNGSWDFFGQSRNDRGHRGGDLKILLSVIIQNKMTLRGFILIEFKELVVNNGPIKILKEEPSLDGPVGLSRDSKNA